jgi:hypothetical protein
MTRIDSLVIPNPNREIVEDRKKKSSYGIKDIKTVMNRMKLIIFFYDYIKAIDKPIVYYDYPRYSLFWYLVSLFKYHSLVFDVVCLSIQPELSLNLYDPRMAPPGLLAF